MAIPEVERWKRFPAPWRTLGPQMAEAVRAAARGEPTSSTPYHRRYQNYRPGRKPGNYKRLSPAPNFSGAALRRQRQAAKYSQSGLAYLLGTSQGRVSAWELGAERPSADRLSEIAKILHCLVSDLTDFYDVASSGKRSERSLTKTSEA